MYFKILLAYILGYVNIEVEGYFIERFINICNSKKIFLWNMKRKHSTIIRVNIGIRDFKKIKEIAKNNENNINIKILYEKLILLNILKLFIKSKV